MAPPTYQDAGAVVRGTGALTVQWPTHAVDDVALLFVETANQAATLTTAAGFVEVTNQGIGTAGAAAATRLTVFWCRATSAAQAAPVVADSGARQTAFILTFRGCIATGNPWDVFAGNTAASTTAISIPGATTTVAETRAVMAVSNAAAIAAPMVQPTPVNSSLTNVIKRLSTQPDGVGGSGDGLPVGVFSYTAVGNGPGNNAADPRWKCLVYAPTPAGISADIDAADLHGVTLVLVMAGNKPQYRDANGNYSAALYLKQLQRFVTPNVTADLATKIADAITNKRIVVYAVDEPNRAVDGIITPTQVNDIGGMIKATWPGATVIARVSPSLLASGWDSLSRPAGGYTNIDYAWSQYNNNHGKDGVNPTTLWAEERAAIANANLNMGLCVSLNLWAGGIAVDTATVAACWDYDGPGGAATSGYIKGDREGAAQTNTVTCGNLGTPIPSLVASPAWIERFVALAIADGGFPFVQLWNHATGTTSSEFNTLYLRSDFVASFDAALAAGAAATPAAWRTPK